MNSDGVRHVFLQTYDNVADTTHCSWLLRNQSLNVYRRRLGEHRRWSQNGLNNLVILTS
jgi:hypothetical protein